MKGLSRKREVPQINEVSDKGCMFETIAQQTTICHSSAKLITLGLRHAVISIHYSGNDR